MALDATGIGAAYQQAFGRQPDQGEINYWTQYQSAGPSLDNDTLVYYLMKQVRAPDGQQKRRDLITRAYQEKLHRAPSDGEVEWWGAQIIAHEGQGGDDGARGRDEPFTYAKMISYVIDHDAQQAASAAPPPQPQQQQQPAQQPQQPQPAQQKPAAQPHPQQGFKWPWQK